MCAGNLAVSLLIVGVGWLATRILRRPATLINKQRERKFWILTWVLVLCSMIELTYSLYEQIAKPNPQCAGFFPVRTI